MTTLIVLLAIAVGLLTAILAILIFFTGVWIAIKENTDATQLKLEEWYKMLESLHGNKQE